jgi:tetratricopeptide (TPR) repeat protein
MKTLEKDRTRRYETANGLAADVERYLNEEPVVACPPSASYRFKKFARRNRGRLALASVVGCALLLIVGSIAGSVGWAARNRAAIEEEVARERAARTLVIEQTVQSALQASTEHMKAKNWPQAIAETRRAEAALKGEYAPEALQSRVDERRNDLAMVTRLEEIRLEAEAFREEGIDDSKIDSRYALAFREYGIGLAELDADATAERIRRSELAEELVVALDHWADWSRANLDDDEGNWQDLVALAMAIDDDPLRNRLRSLWGKAVTEETNQELTELISLPPSETASPIALCLLAKTLNRVGRAQEAISVLREAQRTHPSDLWANQMLASMLHQETPDEGESIRFFTAALALRPHSAGLHNSLGNALRKTGDVDAAVWEYRRAIELAPEYDYPHFNIGSVLDEMGDLKGAVREYQKAIELNPDNADAHNNIGGILRRRGDLEGAIREFHKAIAIAPGSARAHHNLGKALLRKGDVEGAIREHRSAIQLEPVEAIAHSGLAIALQRKGDTEGAIREYRIAVELDPDWAGPHLNLGNMLKSRGDLENAIREYEIAIELDPDWAAPHVNLGSLLMRKGDLECAIREIEIAIELAPEATDLHTLLGFALLDQADLNGAAGAFQKAVALAPDQPMHHMRLANVLRQKGDHEKALREFNLAVELFPDPTGRTADDWGYLGQALYRAGRFDEARDALEQVIELRGDDGPANEVGPRWWYYIMTLWELGERDVAIAYFRQLDEEVAEDLPESMKSLRDEAAELLNIDSQQAKELDDVN